MRTQCEEEVRLKCRIVILEVAAAAVELLGTCAVLEQRTGRKGAALGVRGKDGALEIGKSLGDRGGQPQCAANEVFIECIGGEGSKIGSK